MVLVLDGAKKGFIKGEALGLFKNLLSKISKIALIERGYLAAIVRKYLSEVKFADKKTAPQQRNKSTRKKTTTFCYTIPPSLT